MIIEQFGEKAYSFFMTPIAQDARITILEGSVRSGKTVAMIPKVLMLLKSGPPGLGLITGVSKDTIMNNVLRDLFEIVGEENYSYNRQSGELVMFGREIKVVGAKDEGSEKYIRGLTVAWAYCDELSLMPESFFKQLLNRMSVKGARLYGTTNPDNPYHYLYVDYISNVEKLASGMVRVWHFELDDNPSLDEEYKTFIRGAYSGLFYMRFILGKWVVAEGAIYDMFGEKNKYKDGHGPNYDLFYRRYYVIDYGTANPFALMEVIEQKHIITGKTEYFIENEWYYDSKKAGRQKEDAEYAQDVLDFIGGKRYSAIIIDPSAASFKVALRNRSLRARETDDIINADHEVLDGIRLVASMWVLGILKVNEDKCPNLLKETASYIWDEKAGKRGEEKPVKQWDHCLDAVRYFCKTIVKYIQGVK